MFDLEGTPLSFASAPYPTSFPAPGWAEQAPADWWAGLGAAVKQAVSKAGVDPSSVGAICVDTTCCTVVALDAAGQVRRRGGLTDALGLVWATCYCLVAACTFAFLPAGPSGWVRHASEVQAEAAVASYLPCVLQACDAPTVLAALRCLDPL